MNASERRLRRYALRSPRMYGLARRVWSYQDDHEGKLAAPVTVIGDPLYDLELLSIAIQDAYDDVEAALAYRGFFRRRLVRQAMRRLEDERRLIVATGPVVAAWPLVGDGDKLVVECEQRGDV